MNPGLESKLEQLQALIQGCEGVVVAYSGGIDSTLVAKVAYDLLGERAIAVTANSAALLPSDLAEAQWQAQIIGIQHQVVEGQELENPNYAANPINRCYFCKSELYDHLIPLAHSWGYAYVLDGLNADDLQDYRPGIQAAKERGVRSPLAEVGINKLEIRQLTQFWQLPWWNKPAQPCLSSRFPYGEEITLAKLRRVGEAEFYLRQQLYSWGKSWELRVRSQGDLAKLELPYQHLREFMQLVDLEQLNHAFKGLGFRGVMLDLEGFRSGKLNDAISQGLKPGL
ncbi:MAG: ATP-dependent sacrificial sulfur transferase LarE [Pseudanabaenaceae cyanobacterium bins.68]|nr:ATP-dependent sacrificial sulfur transferase LarE [Pseudanabaenaceae cyanobacterium bins.68]